MDPITQCLPVHPSQFGRRRTWIAIQDHRDRQSPSCHRGIIRTNPRTQLGRREIRPLDGTPTITVLPKRAEVMDANSSRLGKHER